MEFIIQEIAILKDIQTDSKLEKRYHERSSIITTYFDLGKKSLTYESLNLQKLKVYRWLDRWSDSLFLREDFYEDFIEERISYSAYKKLIITLLKDKPRSGTPPTFSAAQREQIIALASMSPEEAGLPFTVWSNELLKQEAIHRKIVSSISARQIGRFLKGA